MTINGSVPGELGVAGWKLKLQAAGTNVLTIVTKENLTVAARWDEGDEITLANDSGVVFRGKVKPVNGRGAGGSRSRSYEVYGDEIDAAAVTFTQPWAIYPLEADVAPETPDYANTGQALLFVARHVGQAVPPEGCTQTGTAVTMNDALDVAIAGGCNVAKGTITADIILPPSKVANLSCAAILRECAKRVIDGGTWWDYGAGTPTFNCVTYEEMETVTINTAAMAVEEFEVGTVWRERLPGVIIKLKRQTPRKKVIDGELITFPIATLDETFLKFTSDFVTVTAGTVTPRKGVLEETLDYSDDFTGTEGQAVADYFYAAANHVLFTGLITLKGRYPDFTSRPGKKLDIAGQDPAWAEMGAPIQAVEYNSQGETQISFGRAEHLGFSELAEWLRWLKGRGVTRGEKAERDSGVSTSANWSFGGGGEQGSKDAITNVVLNKLGAGEDVVTNLALADGTLTLTVRRVDSGEGVAIEVADDQSLGWMLGPADLGEGLFAPVWTGTEPPVFRPLALIEGCEVDAYGFEREEDP